MSLSIARLFAALKHFVSPRRRSATGRARPRLEQLEDRSVPAVLLGRDTLLVTGSGAADVIHVSKQNDGLVIDVNGVVRRGINAAQVRSIRILAGAGDDRIVVDANVTVPAFIDAGAGNDIVRGGGGNDGIAGGSGDDVLSGGPGRDVLFGGPGHDLFSASVGQDRLLDLSSHDTFRAESTSARLAKTGFGLLPPAWIGRFQNPGLLGIRTDRLRGAPNVNDRHHDNALTDDFYVTHGYGNPPTYGPHRFADPSPGHPAGAPVLPTGVYRLPLADVDLVHNLEHGHVVITYNPRLLSATIRRQLEAQVRSFSKQRNGSGIGIILVPRPRNTAPISLLSWAHRLNLRHYDGAIIRAFAITNRGYAPEGFQTP